jgi:hypothetical protein
VLQSIVTNAGHELLLAVVGEAVVVVVVVVACYC